MNMGFSRGTKRGDVTTDRHEPGVGVAVLHRHTHAAVRDVVAGEIQLNRVSVGVQRGGL